MVGVKGVGFRQTVEGLEFMVGVLGFGSRQTRRREGTRRRVTQEKSAQLST